MFSYFICAYIVLKFNNNFPLLFRSLCNSIYVERTKRQSNLPLFTCDYPDCSPLMGPLNPFHQEGQHAFTLSYIANICLWGNRFITFEFIFLFIKEWINSGIFFVNDIIDNNGKITQEFILHKLKINLIGYLNLVFSKKLFQRIGQTF